MPKNTKRKVLRNRPKNENVDRIPQINLVGYFSNPLTNPVELFADIISTVLTGFGDHNVHFTIQTKYIPKAAPNKAFHSNLSLVDLNSSMQAVVSEYLAQRNLGLLDATVERRWTAYLANEIEAFCADAEEPHFRFICYMDEGTMGDLLEGTRRLFLARDMVAALDRTGECYYAFVDADESARVDYGLFFGSGFEGYAPWRCQVNKIDWLRDFQERRERVRFPSWGTYLGPDLAAKANKIGSLFDQYTGRKAEEPDQYAERFDSGGLFLAVGKNPADAVFLPPDRSGSAPVQNAAWLWSWFRRAGMI